jgi:hypothetical protein
MRRLLVTLATIGVLLAAAPAGADLYGQPIWCTLDTTGLPGGAVSHRLAVQGFWLEPQYQIIGYAVFGINISTTADAFGYGHTSSGGAFPISFAWTDSPTFASSIVRHWRVNFDANLVGDTRVTDVTTGGTFTATGVTSIQCGF